MKAFPQEVLSEIKKHLEEERMRVNSQITDLTAQDPFSDNERLNDNAASDTEANEEVNHERMQAMLDELKQKGQAIDEALLRIKDGTYGLCLRCKKMIDTDRLAAIPTATLCISCESQK